MTDTSRNIKQHGGSRTNCDHNGGKRPGAGRPKLVADDEDTVVRELVFPALCAAFRATPGKFGNRTLTVQLSKLEIQAVYGKKGLDIWQRYFTMQKKGGCNAAGVPFHTIWVLHFGSYAVAKMLVESLGHTMKDLPNPGFPPEAMEKRLDAYRERALKRSQAKALAERTAKVQQ